MRTGVGTGRRIEDGRGHLPNSSSSDDFSVMKDVNCLSKSSKFLICELVTSVANGVPLLVGPFPLLTRAFNEVGLDEPPWKQ
jgi:hypothetical protein